jgi:formylglycine-generating enzyme required for sulfatase activity
MKVVGRSAIYSRGKHVGFLALLLLVLAALAVWRAGTTASVSAQSKTKVNPKDGLTYVWIPPGTFQMGCSSGDSECDKAVDGLGSNENPAHSVRLTKGFWIGQTPVTQAAYTKVVGSNPSHFKGDQLPVETVSWDDAQAYCKGVEMKLPTEAEWEYAARGGNPAALDAPPVQIAWYSENSGGTTHPVGQKQGNAYGLYDMLGNVLQWTADWFGPYDGAGVVDPKGPPTSTGLIPARVQRGSSYYQDATSVRVSIRVGFMHDDREGKPGFRCAGN